MTSIALIRHGVTAWNREHRLQGRTDTALSPEGERAVASWRTPSEFDGFEALASPLSRARRTAEILLGRTPRVDHRLIEMSYGDWEGENLAKLRARLGSAMTENEARGLDFQPPGGESPRMVMARLRPFIAETAIRRQGVTAVTHKGVIRACYALATGWDMTQDAPDRLADGQAHVFRASPDGRLAVERLNLPLARVEEGTSS